MSPSNSSKAVINPIILAGYITQVGIFLLMGWQVLKLRGIYFLLLAAVSAILLLIIPLLRLIESEKEANHKESNGE